MLSTKADNNGGTGVTDVMMTPLLLFLNPESLCDGVTVVKTTGTGEAGGRGGV